MKEDTIRDLSTNTAGVFAKVMSAMLSFLIFALPLESTRIAGASGPQGIQGQPIARIPFSVNNGLITVPVWINDSRELRMYLDTGMSAAIVVLFHKELIEETGLQNTQRILLGGAGPGEQKAGTMAQGALVRLEGLKMTAQTVVVLEDSREASEWPLDGIIGKTLFDKYLAHLDYEASVLTLYDPAAARIDASLHPIPINLDIGLPIMEAEVLLDGKTETPVRLVVDLGHRNALLLNLDEAKGIQAPPAAIRSIAGRGIQGEVFSRIGRLPELKLGRYSLKDIPTSFLDPGSNMGLSREIIDGDLGQLILNKFDVIIDYLHKQIFLTPNRYFDGPFEYDMSGLVLEQDREGAYFVRYVLEDSPAAESGIMKGDKVILLNEKDVRGYPYKEVFALLREEGREIRITLERNNERFIRTLKLRRLV